MTFLSTLPHVEWTWTSDGKRVQVWVWPQDHPSEVDIDMSDLMPAGVIAEGSDQHVAEFSFDAVVMLDTETAADEFALDALLVQRVYETESGQRRGGK